MVGATGRVSRVKSAGSREPGSSEPGSIWPGSTYPITPIKIEYLRSSPSYHYHHITGNVIFTGLDDRTAGESGIQPLSPGERLIPKSRWGTVSSYLSRVLTLHKIVLETLSYEMKSKMTCWLTKKLVIFRLDFCPNIRSKFVILFEILIGSTVLRLYQF